MASTSVVGLQWGDEAKGKIVDILTENHHVVVRYNGGANAGHTVVRDGKTYKLSLLPTGILSPHMTAVIGNGVVVNPTRFMEEVKSLREAGIPIAPKNLILSNHAHLIFPYHMEEETLGDEGSGKAIGTTGRGIGPCYADKVSRTNGIRVGDLLHPEFLRQRLRTIVPRKNTIFRALSASAKQFDADALCDEYLGYAEVMKPYVADTTKYLHEAIGAGKNLLFEAAQGSLLDVDHGTYPFVTSSNTSTTGIWAGSGVPARNLNRIIGVIKAYTTRVGHGPFPTELTDGPTGLGETIRKTGREYGTVTGRPRRCGWFDAVAVKHTARLGGVDELSLMLLDVLSVVPNVNICTAYELDGERITDFPADAFLLERCKPIYETVPGWMTDVSRVRRPGDLPKYARQYIDRVSEIVGKPVSIVSVGPDREQTILMK
ncbi:MAG: adenylosuccinate synthase [Gemmataceae bacterium]